MSERKVGTISRGIRCPIIREGDNLADIVVNIPENKLNVVVKARDDEYVENTLNSYNKPVETKLKELGWNYKFDLKEGMTRTYQVLKEIEG